MLRSGNYAHYVEGELRFQAPLSSSLKKEPWVRIATCLLDSADSKK